MKTITKILFIICAVYSLSVFAANDEKEIALWKNITHDFRLDHHEDSPRVRTEMRRLLANKRDFERVLGASKPYLYYIYQQTKARHLPAEIAFIPFIESEFSPNDFTGNARGLWQLMPGTARMLGVRDDDGGRQNIVKSTNAALNHFKYLGGYYKNNWGLAIAAYNGGQGTVRSAIYDAGSRNYWDLDDLPNETRHYLPKLFAVVTIIQHADKYGIKLPPIPNKPYFKEVTYKKPTTLKQQAQVLHVSDKALYALNPQYKFALSPYSRTNHLYVPTTVTA